MKIQKILLTVSFGVFVCFATGCLSQLAKISAGQSWSENYALLDGTQANDPAIIDGNLKTVGKSQYVETSQPSNMRNFAIPSEAVIILPEQKPIHRVVIYSDDLQIFDLWVTDSNGRWEKIKEIKSVKTSKIDLRLSRTAYTAGIKIRVRRTKGDSEMRRKNTQRLGGFTLRSGKTKALASIAEIEIYGFTSKNTDATETPNSSSDSDDELDQLLKQ